MSELKTYKMVDEKYCADCVCVIPSEVYLKSEADKVIADLEESHKKEIEQLLMEIVELKADYKEACGRLQTANIIKDEQLAATRHEKYKRCLAMAKLCRSVLAAAIFIPEKGGTDKQAALYMKWEKCWLALADKFKAEVK